MTYLDSLCTCWKDELNLTLLIGDTEDGSHGHHTGWRRTWRTCKIHGIWQGLKSESGLSVSTTGRHKTQNAYINYSPPPGTVFRFHEGVSHLVKGLNPRPLNQYILLVSRPTPICLPVSCMATAADVRIASYSRCFFMRGMCPLWMPASQLLTP